MKRWNKTAISTLTTAALLRVVVVLHAYYSCRHFGKRGIGMTGTSRYASFALLTTAVAVLSAVSILLALYVYPAYAQDDAVPLKPRGLDATATHDQVVLTWDDPEDASITGYVILRRVRVNDTGGDFNELVENTGTAALTYTDNEVVASTTYTYRVKAVNEHGVSERSRWKHIDTLALPVPDQPMGLDATAAHDSVTLTWDDPGDDSITGYVILRRVRVNDQGGEFDELVADTGTPVTTYVDVTVASSTTYTYRIKAVNQYGTSERSRWFHIDTLEVPEPESNPADLAPSNLVVELASGEVVVSWDAPFEDDAGVTGYEILRAEREGDLATLVSDTGNTATAYTDATVATAGTSYSYRVKAIRDGERSQASNEARVHLKPARPAGLTATATHDQVALTWDDPGDDSITGYVILRRVRVNDQGGEFDELVADTGTPVTTYVDVMVASSTAYTYRIKAVNQYGTSERSHWFHIDTLEVPEPESNPADLAPSNLVVELASGEVVVSWDAPFEDAGSVTGYELLRARGGDEPAILSADIDNTSTAYTDNNADAPGESYAYRVKAIRDVERSQVSEEAVIQLPGPLPLAPSGLIAIFDAAGVALNWQPPVENASSIRGYEVLRAQGDGELATLVSDTGDASVAYTDPYAAGPGEVYAYRVRAIRGDKKSSDSNEARVQLPLDATLESGGLSSGDAETGEQGPTVNVTIGPVPIMEGAATRVTTSSSGWMPGKAYRLRYNVVQVVDQWFYEQVSVCEGRDLNMMILGITFESSDVVHAHEGVISHHCPAGSYMLLFTWRTEDREESGSYFHSFEVLEANVAHQEEEDNSVEYVDYIAPHYTDILVEHPPFFLGLLYTGGHGRPLNFEVGIAGLVPDDDLETVDYVVSVRVIDNDLNLVPHCNEDGVGGSYLIKTVSDNRQWGRDLTLSAVCTRGGVSNANLIIELLNGNSEYLLHGTVIVR